MKPFDTFHLIPTTGEGGRLPEREGRYLVFTIHGTSSHFTFDPRFSYDVSAFKKFEFWSEFLPEPKKSAEEILNKHSSYGKVDDNPRAVVLASEALKAMEEYRNQ